MPAADKKLIGILLEQIANPVQVVAEIFCCHSQQITYVIQCFLCALVDTSDNPDSLTAVYRH